MVKKLFDWYQAVNPEPAEELLQKRRLAITDLIDRLQKDEDAQLLVATIQAVVNGFAAGFKKGPELAEVVAECIRKHDLAFPDDLSERWLELRVCCAIALGEILTSADGDTISKAQLAAGLVVSAVGLRPQAPEKHLQGILHELEKSARMVLGTAAVAQRKREKVEFQSLDALTSASDIPALGKQIKTTLEQQLRRLEQQVAMEREELDILWWLYNDFSERLSKPLTALGAGSAAICCGIEVADRVICPPLDSVRHMVAHAVEKGRNAPDSAETTLEQTVGQWEAGIYNLLVPATAEMQEFVRGFPILFPLTWLALRLHESQGSPTWHQEFESKTSISPKKSYRPAMISVQAFNESVALKMYLLYQENEE